LWQFNNFDLFSFPKMPPSHIYLKKKKKKNVGVAGHPVWPGHGSAIPFGLGMVRPPPGPKGVVQLALNGRPGGGRTTPRPNGVASHPNIFFFFFFFSLKKKKKKKKVIGAFREKKKVKVVKLSQFKSLGGLSIIFETLNVKVKIGG
jgi:hypothetical protein